MSSCRVTTSKIGATPILDFDGTLTDLSVDWNALRRRLGVARINEIWSGTNPDWSAVDQAEFDAAGTSAPIGVVITELERAHRFAILTSNNALAVRRFLARYPEISNKCVLVVGRHELAGPKSSFEIFERGFRRCERAVSPKIDGASATYLGNEDYELDFARRLGAHAVHVDELQDPPPLLSRER